MSAHTPGPWVATSNAGGADISDEAKGRAIAHVYGERMACYPDARLIAAAPDLLEALAVCLAAIVHMPHNKRCSSENHAHDEDNRCDCGVEELRFQVEAALRKAVGP
jgi:hypothetical protein